MRLGSWTCIASVCVHTVACWCHCARAMRCRYARRSSMLPGARRTQRVASRTCTTLRKCCPTWPRALPAAATHLEHSSQVFHCRRAPGTHSPTHKLHRKITPPWRRSYRIGRLSGGAGTGDDGRTTTPIKPALVGGENGRRRDCRSAAWPAPPLHLAGVSIGMKRGCQQNDSLADGYFCTPVLSLVAVHSCRGGEDASC